MSPQGRNSGGQSHTLTDRSELATAINQLAGFVELAKENKYHIDENSDLGRILKELKGQDITIIQGGSQQIDADKVYNLLLTLSGKLAEEWKAARSPPPSPPVTRKPLFE